MGRAGWWRPGQSLSVLGTQHHLHVPVEELHAILELRRRHREGDSSLLRLLLFGHIVRHGEACDDRRSSDAGHMEEEV